MQSVDAPQYMQTEIKVLQSLAKVMNDLVTDYMGMKYIYDQHGNVIEKHDQHHVIKFEWNALNQLTSVLSDPIKTDYIYDVFGRRIAKRSQYHTSNYQEIQRQKEQQQRLTEEGKLGYTLFGWQGEQLAWESDLRIGLIDYLKKLNLESDAKKLEQAKRMNMPGIGVIFNDMSNAMGR